MALQLIGVGGAVQEVDATFKSARVSVRPPEVLAWNSIGTQTGLTTVLAAGAPIFSFRNISTNPIMVRRVGIGCIATTAFTAAQRVEYALFVARSFTASDTGGTAIALTGSNAKHRTSLATNASTDMRVATTTALTAGTRTLDTNPLALTGVHIGAAGAGLTPTPDNLFAHNTGDYPLVLAQNEGLVIANNFLMGAAGVVLVYVNLEFAEATSF